MPLTEHQADSTAKTPLRHLANDPYRWLEDRGLPETTRWIAEQQENCKRYFTGCGGLDEIRNRVRAYLDTEMMDQPARVGSRCFYRRRRQGEEQASVYVVDDVSGIERLLADPSRHGPFASVAIHRIANDGSLLAYELKDGGYDRKSIHIADVITGLTLPASVDTGYARGFVFRSDGQGFFYCQDRPAAENSHRICHQLIGERSARVLFERPRSSNSRLVLLGDGLHLGAIHLYEHAGIPVIDFLLASEKELKWHPIFTRKILPFSPILSEGRIFALSYKDAPNGKLIEVHEDGSAARTVIPEWRAEIRQFLFCHGKVYVLYLDRLSPVVQVWSEGGDYLGALQLPTDGSIHLLPAYSRLEERFFYAYQSFIQPPTIFQHSALIEESSLWHKRDAPQLEEMQIQRSHYPAQDGTKIPIFIVTREKPQTSGPRFLIMTSYGGFGISMTPQFSVFVAIMLELGATFALPCIRGGSEFGIAWREAARGRKKQVAIDDFLSAAQWLFEQGIGSPRQTGIFGGSNAGLLVAAAMTRRPDLFGAVLAIAPLLDMVRYPVFDDAAKWRNEYGDPSLPEDLEALLAYSPYHQIEETCDYPATLFVTGDKDDRCNPAHVRKMAAKLQDRTSQKHSILVDHSPERGHSPVLPLSIRIEALAQRVAFFSNELGIAIPREVTDGNTLS